MLLEEDAGLRQPSDKPLEKTSLSLFWLRCWYWLQLLPTMFMSVVIAIDWYIEFRYYVLEDTYVTEGYITLALRQNHSRAYQRCDGT
jgi:hypothetical protein